MSEPLLAVRDASVVFRPRRRVRSLRDAGALRRLHRAAHRIFAEAWCGLAPLALLRVKDLVAPDDPETAAELDWLDV